MQLKEIKPQEYLKGTKSFRFQMLIYVGLIGFAAIVSVPTYFLMNRFKKNKYLEKKQQKEDNEKVALEQVYRLQELLVENEANKRKSGTLQ